MAEGKISIGRVHSNNGEWVEITIKDETSLVEFLEVKVSLENFAKLITGLSYIDCNFQTRGLNLVGKQREYKTVIVACDGWSLKRDEEEAINAVLAPYEVDGWIGRRYDLKNSKNYVGHEGVKVLFERWVEQE